MAVTVLRSTWYLLHLIAGEDNEENRSCSSSIFSEEDDRCPICLNCLTEQEVGFPENCSHIFCVTCILKWAEVSLGSCCGFYEADSVIFKKFFK